MSLELITSRAASLDVPALTLYLALAEIAENQTTTWHKIPSGVEFLINLGLTFSEIKESIAFLGRLGYCDFSLKGDIHNFKILDESELKNTA